jgi:glycosyltransferase involved in cell wall biosynthesis
VPEVLLDGETGLFVPPGDVDKLAETIIDLAGDPDRCARMGRKAYSFVKENFDWEDSVDAMVELYARLIRNERRTIQVNSSG